MNRKESIFIDFRKKISSWRGRTRLERVYFIISLCCYRKSGVNEYCIMFKVKNEVDQSIYDWNLTETEWSKKWKRFLLVTVPACSTTINRQPIRSKTTQSLNPLNFIRRKISAPTVMAPRVYGFPRTNFMAYKLAYYVWLTPHPISIQAWVSSEKHLTTKYFMIIIWLRELTAELQIIHSPAASVSPWENQSFYCIFHSDCAPSVAFD